MINITEVTLNQVKQITIPYQECLRNRPWLFTNVLECPLIPYLEYVRKEVNCRKVYNAGYIHWTGLPFYKTDILDKYKNNFVSMMLPMDNFASSFLFKIKKDHSFYMNFWIARWDKNNEYFATTYAAAINMQDVLDFENENRDLAASHEYFEKGLHQLGFISK